MWLREWNCRFVAESVELEICGSESGAEDLWLREWSCRFVVESVELEICGSGNGDGNL